ncbi:UNVERIFIED_CONTAM: hypothetical protein FKN15_059055 [Acipenser sinensis]
MTRQNQIPTEDGNRVTLALIPLWDMCNHTNGLITTGYNLEDDRCECVALQDYKADEQIYIFYGTRSNAEFVIHNGFFFDNNSHDRVKIKLGVSKSERLYAMKAEVLARAGIPSSSIFALHCSEPPISAQLLAFLRVFCMSEDELKEYLVGEHAIDKIFTLGNAEFPVSWDNEIKLWTFLETRAALLLKTYKTTSEIYIFYGTRSNAEFVIHNGFFFDNNSHDRVKIKLGVSKSERLYAMKAEVLARAGIPSSSIFALHCSEPPISAQLLAFLRVFCMSEDELKEYLVGEHAIDKIFTLGNAEFPVSWDNEIKLWTFLETRAALLLKTYKTTLEADRSLLEKPDLSFHFKIAIKLRLAEKEILEKAVASGQAKREYFQKKLEEGAPLPKYEESNISMLENSVSDSKLPIILGKLEEADETGEQELKMTEALSEVNAGGDALVNGDSKQLNGTNTKNEETLDREENAMKTDDAKENVEEITECNKVAEGQS